MKKILLLIILTACSTETLTQEQLEYRDFCAQQGGAWMKMSELHDGHPTGKTCYGCMPDERNHLCSREEYEGFNIK